MSPFYSELRGAMAGGERSTLMSEPEPASLASNPNPVGFRPIGYDRAALSLELLGISH